MMIVDNAFRPLVYPWQLRRYIKRYYRILIWLGVLGVLVSAGGYITPLITRRIIDEAYPARNLNLFFILSGFIILLNLASVAIQGYSSYLSTYVGNLILYRVRMKVFRALNRISVSYVEGHQSGMFLERIARDAETTASILSSIIPKVVSLLLTAVVTVALMAKISTLVAELVLAFVPLYYVFSSVLSVKLRNLQHLTRLKDEEMTTRAVEAIQGMPTARLFGVGEWLRAKYRTLIREKIRIAFRMLRVNLIWGNLGWGVSYGWGVLLTVGGWYLVFKNRLTLGDAVALGMYIPLLLKPANEALSLYQYLISSSVPTQRILEVLNSADAASITSRASEFQVKRTIKLDKVAFSYTGSNWRLNDVSLDFRCGETTVVIGATGSGKTTLLKILAGTYDTYSGTIFVDDRDLRDVGVPEYLRNVAMVMPDNFFFSGSIMENMLITRPHLDRKEVIEKARFLGAHEWIESLPCGYDTLLGIGGSRLSSGQLQKMAVLRAVLKRPRLLLLDEVTSAMDVESERKILNGLRSLCTMDCIRVMTTHRLMLTTELWVDRVVVLDNGAILEAGSPRELYNRGGKYRYLMDLTGLGKLLV